MDHLLSLPRGGCGRGELHIAKIKRMQITPSGEERARLKRHMNHPHTPRKHAWRAHITLELGAGCGLSEAVQRIEMSTPTVWPWF